MELIKRLNQRQQGFTWAHQSGGVFPIQGSLLTCWLLAPCLPLQPLIEWHLSPNSRNLGKRPPPTPSMLIKHMQWCIPSLLPTVLLISNWDVAVGPPGTPGVIAMTIPTPVACEVGVSPRIQDLYQVSSSCFHFVMVPSVQFTSELTLLPQSRKGTFYFSLIRTLTFPQNIFSPFYHHSSHQLVLCRALLGKSADHASTLWISLLLLWFNTNIIFCDQIADASLPPRARLYPLKPQHTNFTTVKRQCRGE